VLRSSGLTTTQTTTSTQEAKDFKVVVTLSNPPENVRPGLSTTAKIKTAKERTSWPFRFKRCRAHAQGFEEAAKNAKNPGRLERDAGRATASSAPAIPKRMKCKVYSFVNAKKAIFRRWRRESPASRNIEITKGLKAGDEL